MARTLGARNLEILSSIPMHVCEVLICDLFRGWRFGSRAHMLPVLFPIFLKYENALKNSEKNWT